MPYQPSGRFDYQFDERGRALIVVRYPDMTMWAFGYVDHVDVTKQSDPFRFAFDSGTAYYAEERDYPQIALVLKRARWKVGIPPENFEEAERMSKEPDALPAPAKQLPASTSDSVDATIDEAPESDTDFEVEP